MCRAMMLTRTFDAKAVALRKTSRIGTYASSLGQEAVAVGTAGALQRDRRAVAEFSRARRTRQKPEISSEMFDQEEVKRLLLGVWHFSR